MQPFIRTAFNSLRVVESMCLYCGRMVGASRDPEVLTIAEEAHLRTHTSGVLSQPADQQQPKVMAAHSGQ